MSIDLVKTEFIRSKTRDVVRQKADYFAHIIEAVLPIDPEISKLIQPTIEEYSKDTDGLELTDIFLACFIKRYKSLYLLTRNHKDFPTRIFTRSNIFSIEDDRDIRTYALYQYKQTASEIIAPANSNVDDITF